MSRELEFDGWWEGDEVFTCDTCGKRVKFRFDSEDVGTKEHRAELGKQGWLSTKVNGRFIDSCSEDCRNRYIRNQTI